MSWPRVMTQDRVAELLRSVGVESGMHVIVHSSLKGLGYVVNGAHDVIDALRGVVGLDGTVLVPTASGQLTDPADWSNPPVPPEWIDTIRAAMEPFDPKRTPVRNRGTLPEIFMTYPGVQRSHHPISSVAALGKLARELTDNHPLHEPHGVGSPGHNLYRNDGYILLLGVGWATSTTLHTAEFLADIPIIHQRKVVVLAGRDASGNNRFERLKKFPGMATHFEKLRPLVAAAGGVREVWLDDTYRVSLISARIAIDIAVEQLRADPQYFERAD